MLSISFIIAVALYNLKAAILLKDSIMGSLFYLILSVLSSSLITVGFKYFSKYNISLLQIIVVNYLVCIISAIAVNGGIALPEQLTSKSWFPWATVMGLFFIVFFNVIGYTSKTVGVSIATVSNKLSLVIPFVLSIIILKAGYNYWNIIGCIVAIAAVVFTCYKPSNQKITNKSVYALPALLFIGSGLLDFLIKYCTTILLQKEEEYLFFIIGFAVAFTIGIIILSYQFATKKATFNLANVGIGILIGVPNYFSFYYLVKFINSGALPVATAIPVNNICIVVGSALLAFILVKEKLSLINCLGILLAVISIVLMMQ